MTGLPQTPRSSGPRTSVTPSFSFGFGFLPTFHFSPSRLISPQRIFLVGLAGSTLTRVVEPRDGHENGSQRSREIHESPAAPARANGTISANDSLNDSIWSIGSSQHVTAISSIYEDDREDKPYTPTNGHTGDSASAGVISGPNNPFDVSTAEKHDRSQLEQLASAKRRRLSTTVRDPETSLDDSSCPGSHDQPERVWNGDLDKVLYLAYLTYKEFKSRHGESPTLKNQSQNNVISTIIYNCTGSHRSPKQIASRLHRLLRHPPPSAQLPKVDLPDSVLLEVNSPLYGSENGAVNAITEVSNSAKLLQQYRLTPSQITIAYINRADGTKSLEFTRLLSTKDLTMSASETRARFAAPVLEFLNERFFARIATNASISHIHHNINISSTSSSPHSATSPIGSLSTDDGYFKANIKISVESKVPPKGVLAWKCHTQIFRQGHSILDHNEDINAYPFGDRYELPISFLKQFWSGYLTYMQNGGYDESSMDELCVVQIVYVGDGDFDVEKSTVFGILSHAFSVQLNSEGLSVVENIRLKEEDTETHSVSSAPPPLSIESCSSHFDAPLSAPIYNASVVSNLNHQVMHKQETKQDISPNHSMYSPFSADPTPRHFSTSTPAKLPKQSQQNHHSAHNQQGSHANSHTYTHSSYHHGGPVQNPIQSHSHQNLIPNPIQHPVPNPRHVQPVPNPQQLNERLAQDELFYQPYPMVPVGEPLVEMQQHLLNQHRLMMQYQAHFPPGLQPNVPSSAPASQTYFFPTVPPPAPKQTRIEAKKREITFGPILEYDPRKNVPKEQRMPNSTVNKNGMGVHRYSQVSMYQPKKK